MQNARYVALFRMPVEKDALFVLYKPREAGLCHNGWMMIPSGTDHRHFLPYLTFSEYPET